MQYAFISDGKLFIQDNDGALREISSKFVSEKDEEAECNKSLHSWKTGQENVDSYFGSNIIWGKQGFIRPYRKFQFKSVMVKDANTLFYLLTNDYITGLFEYNVQDDEELRLFHKSDFNESGMDYSTDLDKFVAALITEDGSVDLELLDSQGRYEKTLTGGDSKDSNPTFSKHNPQEVLYQTAGIARSNDGFVMAYGPESINRVNVESGQVTSLISDERYDYLLPKDDAGGNLFCIRRPYYRPGYVSPLKTMLYIVTFPFRFFIAILRFLDVFTKLFTEKPKRLIGTGPKPDIEDKYIQVLGKTIYLAKIQKEARSEEGASLVPKTWELVNISKDGSIEIIAKKVSSFDIDKSGQIHFTNGFRVGRILKRGITTIFKYKIIENIKVAKVSSQKM